MNAPTTASFTIERGVAAILIVLTGGSVYGLTGKGATAKELLNEFKMEENQVHFRMDTENNDAHSESRFDRIDTKRRVTSLERYQVESMEQMKAQQIVIVSNQHNIEDALGELKEMQE